MDVKGMFGCEGGYETGAGSGLNTRTVVAVRHPPPGNRTRGPVVPLGASIRLQSQATVMLVETWRRGDSTQMMLTCVHV